MLLNLLPNALLYLDVVHNLILLPLRRKPKLICFWIKCVIVILYGALSKISQSSVLHDGKEIFKGDINNFKQILIIKIKMWNLFHNTYVILRGMSQKF